MMIELLCAFRYATGLVCGQPEGAIWHRKDCFAYRAHAFKPPSYFGRIREVVRSIIRRNDRSLGR